MSENQTKIGVVSCSGEDCLGGTISRLATRKMLEKIYPEETVTICLPLYLAGGEEERSFANDYPTISVDGCSKYCAKRATEKYSGKVSAEINVADIIGKETAEQGPLSGRDITSEHLQMVEQVVEQIQVKFDEVLNKPNSKKKNDGDGGCCCGGNCGC